MIRFYLIFWTLLHSICIFTTGIPQIHHGALVPRDDNNPGGAVGWLLDSAKSLDELGNVDGFTENPITDEPETPKRDPTTPKQDDYSSALNGPITTDSDPDTENVPTYQIQLNKCQNPQANKIECSVATLLIIYPKKCDQEKSKIVTDALQKIPDRQGKLYISQDSCGVFFWRVQLTSLQVKKLREDPDVNDAILDIVPDRPLDGMSPSNGQPPRNSQPQKRDNLKKWNNAFGRVAPIHLSFISEPKPGPPGGLLDNIRGAIGTVTNLFRPPAPEFPTPSDYLFFERSGSNVKVYMLGYGIRKEADDFLRHTPGENPTSIIDNWIYGIEAAQTQTDDSQSGAGTCRASLAVGLFQGVVENSRLIVVKHVATTSSFIDAIMQTLRNIEDANKTLKAKGNRVVIINAGFIPKPVPDPNDPTKNIDRNAEILKSLLQKLVFEQQVVVVAAAGQNAVPGQPLGVRTVPALWSTDPELDIITTGAVRTSQTSDGIPTAFSPNGNAITISAPGTVTCASKNPSEFQQWAGPEKPELGGTGAAAAITGGLAAYFLSLEDLGPLIRRQSPLIPKAVKDVITYFAYPRSAPYPLAVANGAQQWNFPKIEQDLLKIWHGG